MRKTEEFPCLMFALKMRAEICHLVYYCEEVREKIGQFAIRHKIML